MVRESIAILVVLLLLMGVFARARYRDLLPIVLPLGILPLAHLIITGILYLTKGAFFFGVRPAVVIAFTDVLAIAASGVLFVFIGMRITAHKIRRLYLVAMLAYTVLLGWAYVFTTLRVLFM